MTATERERQRQRHSETDTNNTHMHTHAHAQTHTHTHKTALTIFFRLARAAFTGSVACLQLTRPDTRLPKSRADGQGPYLRSSDHLGSEVKEK